MPPQTQARERRNNLPSLRSPLGQSLSSPLVLSLSKDAPTVTRQPRAIELASAGGLIFGRRL
jgi:hypothetical protein